MHRASDPNELEWSDAVHFHPLVGPQYQQGLVAGLRVLLLGESHYDAAPTDGDERETTQDEFKDYWEDTCKIYPGNRFWGRLQRIVTRDLAPTPAESAAAWRRIAFANLVQRFVGSSSRDRPSRGMWATGRPAFDEIVQKLRPHAVLVLGKATWAHIGCDSGYYAQEVIPAPRELRRIWIMPWAGGATQLTWVFHPASNKDSSEVCIAIFSALLDQVRAS